MSNVYRMGHINTAQNYESLIKYTAPDAYSYPTLFILKDSLRVVLIDSHDKNANVEDYILFDSEKNEGNVFSPYSGDDTNVNYLFEIENNDDDGNTHIAFTSYITLEMNDVWKAIEKVVYKDEDDVFEEIKDQWIDTETDYGGSVEVVVGFTPKSGESKDITYFLNILCAPGQGWESYKAKYPDRLPMHYLESEYAMCLFVWRKLNYVTGAHDTVSDFLFALFPKPDWSAKQGEAGHIKNKPVGEVVYALKNTHGYASGQQVIGEPLKFYDAYNEDTREQELVEFARYGEIDVEVEKRDYGDSGGYLKVPTLGPGEYEIEFKIRKSSRLEEGASTISLGIYDSFTSNIDNPVDTRRISLLDTLGVLSDTVRFYYKNDMNYRKFLCLRVINQSGKNTGISSASDEFPVSTMTIRKI